MTPYYIGLCYLCDRRRDIVQTKPANICEPCVKQHIAPRVHKGPLVIDASKVKVSFKDFAAKYPNGISIPVTSSFYGL